MYRLPWTKLWFLSFLVSSAIADAPPASAEAVTPESALSVRMAAFADASAVPVQPEMTLSLEEAHRLSLANYQLVGAVEEQVEQAQQVRREVASALFPLASLRAVYTHNLITAEFEFGGQKIRVLPGDDYNLSLAITQPIYAGQRLLKARKQATLGVEVADRGYETTVQNVLLDVTRAFYAALAVQDNIEITRRSVEVTRETLRTAESLYRAGESVETAVLRARVAHSAAQRELLEAGNSFQIVKQQLALLTGVGGDFRVIRPEKPQALTAPLDDLIQTGLRTRPEILGLDLQREISEIEIERQRGQYLPEVRAEAIYLRRRATFPSPQLGSIAVNANWTVFDSGRRGAEVAYAKSRLRELELRRSLLAEQIELQIRTTYLDVETTTASVKMLTEQVDFARTNAESTSRAFRVGEATDLDILVSNETLTRSERQLALATYELDLATYELRRAVGLLDSEGGANDTGGKE